MAKYETLVDIYHDAIKTFPDHPLFGTKRGGQWHWTTYLEFGKTTDAFRAGLAALGVERGDRVAIIANNRVEWAVAAYACYGLGAPFVPMYEAQPPKDWEYIARDCEAKVLIVATDAIAEQTRELLDKIPSLKFIVSLDPKTKTSDKVKSFEELARTEPKTPTIKPSAEDTAGLLYTSGTTGDPKGVILSHRNFASNVSAIHEVFPMSSMDRSLSFLPWAHSFGQTVELHGLFSMGASLALVESVDKILDNLAETKPTLLISVPRIFNRLYAAVQKQLAARPAVIRKMVDRSLQTRGKQRNGEEVSLVEGLVLAITDKVVFSKVRARFGGELKYAFSGGAAISKEVAEFIDGLGITIYEGYGLTETSPIATANWPGSRKIGSVGRAIPGVRIEIGEESEIIVYGPNVMQGYHNRKEETDEVMLPDGGFRTGDMGRKDADGFVYITGRIKEQYKLENGKYVVPTPIEEQLKLSAYVLNVMVYGDNKPDNVALVVANVDAVKEWGKSNGVAESNVDALLAHPKVRALFTSEIERYGAQFKGFEEIRDFALISEDFTTENGLLTPSLKVKRRSVFDKYGSIIEGLYAKKAAKSADAKTRKKAESVD